jgi:hypothetical protein
MGCQLTLMLQFVPLIVALVSAAGDVLRPALLESAAVVRGFCFSDTMVQFSRRSTFNIQSPVFNKEKRRCPENRILTSPVGR